MSHLPSLLLCLPLLLFPLEGFSQSQWIGSNMTNNEEASALAEDMAVAGLIKQASSTFSSYVSDYESGSISWEELQSRYDTIYAGLPEQIQEQVQSSSGPIHAISYDYDSEHLNDYTQHIQTLIGLAQNELGIEPSTTFMPPLPDTDPSYPNLVVGGKTPSSEDWKLSAGDGSLVNGQMITNSPNGASFSQTIETTPGTWYMVSGYITGAYEGTDKYGTPYAYSGNLSVLNGNPSFPQVSDEIDTSGITRRYFWIEANETSMTLMLSGAGAINSENGPLFQEISLRKLDCDCSTSEGQNQAMALAQSFCPPVSTIGPKEIGWYPQVESLLPYSSNLIDGEISLIANVDMSALGNAGHPYWYFGKENENPVDKWIKIVNGLNGANGLTLPAGADPTTNGPVPIPSADYTLSCSVYVPNGSEGSIRIAFSGTNLSTGEPIDKFYEDFNTLPPGISPITLQIPSSSFPSGGTFFRPSITFTNTGSSPINLYNAALTASVEVYDQINSINPYNPSRSWYNPSGCSLTYDFISENVSYDWATALTGNTMFAASVENASQTSAGIVLSSQSESTSVYSDGGIQSTQLIDPMREFSIQAQFIVLSNDPGYEPTFAIWTYGESQRGPSSPLSHRNAPSSDIITEFDCEMGSDPNEGQPSAGPGFMYMRPGSYIGYEAGGHNEFLPSGANWILMPNFWERNEKGSYEHYMLTLSGNWSNGNLLLTRSIENIDTQEVTSLGTQNLGKGPFSPMYIKLALENPSWNSKSHSEGSASLAIEKIIINQGEEIPDNIPHKIPLSEMDYVWFTPGGGGGISYVPFCIKFK